MSFFARATTAATRINWRNPENLLRLGVFAAVLGIIGTAFLLRDQLNLAQVGYAGVALSALVASAGMIVPVPALAAACTAAALDLNPLLIGLIAGSTETLGELSGYFLGFSGRGVIQNTRLYQRLEGWLRRRGWLLLFVISLVPNPVFDFVGIAAGALRYPLWQFLGVVLVGKLLKFLIFAYACSYGIEWLTDLFGI